MLYLSRSSITDNDGMDWKNLISLRSLYLSNTSISDRTVKQLEHLPLEELNLQYTKITPACLESIAKMRELKLLNLGANPHIGTGLESWNWTNLSESNLTDLNLASTDLTDAQLEILLRLPHLSTLIVEGNQEVTVRGIFTLTQFTHLKHLDIFNTGIKFDDYSLLRQHLKGCSISFIKY